MKTPPVTVLFTGRSDTTFGQPNELLPLLGRPMLQRVVEALVRTGIQEIHVVLGDDPQPTRRFLDDGARWGCRFVYHHVRDAESLGSLARRLRLRSGQACLVADAAQLPDGAALSQVPAPAAGSPGCVWVGTRDGAPCWSGWGLFDGGWLTRRAEAADYAAHAHALLAATELERRPVADVLSVTTIGELLGTARGLLEATGTDIARARGCRVHPAATVLAPAHLGRDVRIEAGAVVGPNAIVGDGALIERGVQITDAVVLPDTYVGEGLELRHCVAGGNRLANVRLGTVIDLPDRDLLSAVPGHPMAGRPGPGERALALALLAVAAPLRLVASGHGRRRRGSLRIARPGSGSDQGEGLLLSMTDPRHAQQADGRFDLVRHFVDSFYPGLREVAAGRLRLVGPTPRSPRDVGRLPGVWRALYDQAHCGLLNEGLLQGAGAPSSDLDLAADSLACAAQGDAGVTRRLILGYFAAVWRRLAMRRIPGKGRPGPGGRSDERRRTAWNSQLKP